MDAKSEVILLTNDSKTGTAVTALLDSDRDLVLGTRCQRMEELAERLERSSVSVVLVDVDPNPFAMLESLRPLISRYTSTVFMVLAETAGSDLFLKAMQVGVRYVQVKSTLDVEFLKTIKQLSAAGFSIPRQRGNIVTVLSAGGGCGATTLAVNLANEIQLDSSEPVLLVDCDYHYGSIAFSLGIDDSKYSVADVFGYDGHIDPQLIRSTALEYSENLHVLLSPASTAYAQPALLHEDKLVDFLSACKQAYRWTVIDAPRLPFPIVAKMADTSIATLIALQLTIKDIRVTESIVSALREAGVSPKQLRIVVNRCRKRYQMIPLEEAQKALGEVPVIPLSNDFRSAIRSSNYGRPLSQEAGRSVLRREVVRLADIIQTNSRNA